MNKDLEALANAWYKQWLKLHDPYLDDFEDELYKVLPQYQFTLDIKNDCWILIGER